MRLVTSEEMQRLEQVAAARGVTIESMMERAGRATALAAQERLAPSAPVLVLVGPGNNGGDGLVAARYLYLWGHPVCIYIWRRDLAQDSNLERAQALGIPVTRAEDDPEFNTLDQQTRVCSCIVDALLGTGVSGAFRGTLPDLLDHVRQGVNRPVGKTPLGKAELYRPAQAASTVSSDRALIVAVDLPSGLNANTGEADERALPADLTVSFGFPKRGHVLSRGVSLTGELVMADIGIDAALAEGISVQIVTPQHAAGSLPKRPKDAHKGTFGKALIIAGSTNYVGAPRLCAEGAYRVGAGLVTLAVAEAVYPMLAAKVTEPTFLVLPHDLGALVPAGLRVLEEPLRDYDALLVGPGLGRDSKTGEFLWELLGAHESGSRRTFAFDAPSSASDEPLRLPPTVIDADGLNLLSERHAWWKQLPAQCIVTPHPGEMARLLDTDSGAVQEDRLKVAQRAATQWGCTVVLKGAHTVVAAPDGATSVIPFANPLLASAGTGDVLAGAIVGCLAQGLASYEAAVCGAYLHGLAGELARVKLGDAGLLASDLLPLLPEAMKRLRG